MKWPVVFLIACLCAGQSTSPAASLAISVIDAATREPLPGVQLALWRTDVERPLIIVRTGPSGLANLAVIEAGRYSLTVASLSGYSFDSRAVPPLTIRPEQAAQFSLALNKGGMISGTVTEKGGKPPLVAKVVAFAQSSPGSFPTITHTDSEGRYRFPELAVGNYIVRAGPPAMFSDVERKSGYSEVYYPDAATRDQSDPVRVLAGSHIDGIDFRLEHVPLFHIGGYVLGVRNGIVGAQRCEADWPDGWIGTGVSPRGEFRISGLLPGTYCITYEYPESSRPVASAPLRVTIVDRDIEGSLLSPSPP